MTDRTDPSGATRFEPDVRGYAADTDAATGVTSYLLAGPLCFGGIGYGLDRWLGTRGVVAVGVLIGMALSVYVIWLRYGRDTVTSTSPGALRPGHQVGESASVKADSVDNATNEESQ